MFELAVIETWYNQDLKRPVKVHYLNGNVFSQDNGGNLIGVNVFDGDNPATLSGSVSASVIRADGATVAVSGTLSGNQCSVVLPQAAYETPGVLSIVIKLTTGTTVTSLCAVVANVYRSTTSAIVDPGTIIPDISALIAAIEAAISSIPADYSELLSAIATDYSPSKTYRKNSFAWYDGVLKRCTVPIATPESYNSSHWENAVITDNVSSNTQYVDSVTNKNLLPLRARETTVNNVVFTPYDNGTINMNGTASGTIYYMVGELRLFANEEYLLSGMPADGISLQVLNEQNTQVIVSQNNGSEQKFSVQSDGLYNVRITTYSGKVVSNVLVSPMIRTSNMTDKEFVPFGNNDIAVFIGDSYSQANSLSSANLDKTMRFTSQVCRKMIWQEKNFAVGGMGFIEGNTTFEDQLDNAISDTTYNHARVKHVIVAGGLNDLSSADLSTDLAPAVQSVINKASSAFPNAKIILIPLLNYNGTISQQGFFVYKTISSVCKSNKCCFIPNAYTWLVGMLDMILTDGVHPNIDGHTLIASHIITALTTGDSFPYPASCSMTAISAKIDTEQNNYCCEVLEGTQITINAIFTLSEAAATYERLFEYSNPTNKNNPLFIGNYGKNIPCYNMATGETGVLLVNQESSGNGYKNYVSATTPLPVGTWKVLSESVLFGLQEYSGNMN